MLTYAYLIPSFQDIVDILVGWHVDIGQSPSLKMHISSVLLSWHSFWIIDLEFSAGLLRQFIEDVESFTEDVEEYNSNEQADQDFDEITEKIASVVQVFNTVLSCLRSKSSQRQKVNHATSKLYIWIGTVQFLTASLSSVVQQIGRAFSL